MRFSVVYQIFGLPSVRIGCSPWTNETFMWRSSLWREMDFLPKVGGWVGGSEGWRWCLGGVQVFHGGSLSSFAIFGIFGMSLVDWKHHIFVHIDILDSYWKKIIWDECLKSCKQLVWIPVPFSQLNYNQPGAGFLVRNLPLGWRWVDVFFLPRSASWVITSIWSKAVEVNSMIEDISISQIC